MAQVEPMDVESDYEDKENSLQINNVLSRASCTEKGYEELDVSEMSMKLRYSVTPCASPMSKSFTSNCRDSKFVDTDESFNNGNINLSQSLNSTLTNIDSKLSKMSPLQQLTTDTLGDINRNPLNRISLDSNPIDPNITITLNDSDHLDNLSLPSTTSSLSHTPEATTPTKEIPKDGGSPIMRGLKSVFSMFRPSQSPIPAPEIAIQTNNLIDSPAKEEEVKPLATLVSTPISAHKYKESLPKGNSPLKDSVVFTDDLEKELLWKNETTIIFKEEKIPISKLYLQQSHSNNSEVKQNECLEKGPDISVEYMDISHNETIVNDKTMTEIEPGLAMNVTETIANIESDSEFVDCETTFTKNDLDISQNMDNVSKEQHDYLLNAEQNNDRKDLEFNQIHTVNIDAPMSSMNVINSAQRKDLNTETKVEKIENNVYIEKKIERNVTYEEEKDFANTKLSQIDKTKVESQEDSFSDKIDNPKNVTKDNSLVMVTDNQLNNVETSRRIEDSRKLSTYVDDTLNLSNSCISENNIGKEQIYNSLPIKKILDASSETSLSEIIPQQINITTDLLVSGNNITIENLNEDTIDKALIKHLQSDIDHVINDTYNKQLVEKNDVGEVVCALIHKDISGTENALQNNATFSMEKTTFHAIVVDACLSDNTSMVETNKIIKEQLKGPKDICNEDINSELSSETSNTDNFDKINSEINYSSNKEPVSIPTDIPLPSESELEQDMVDKKHSMTEELSDVNLKVTSYDILESAACTKDPEINKTLPLKLDFDASNTSAKNISNKNYSQDTQSIETISDTSSVKENDVEICIEKQVQTVSEGCVDSCKAIQNSAVLQDNSDYQIIPDNFNSDIDLKIQEVDEIITSASHSPYVSVSEISLDENEKDNLEAISNPTQSNKDNSPPIVSKKGYDINFDDIENPFATKTRIRLSPTPETPIKKSLPLNNMSNKKSTDKKRHSLKSKQKLHNKNTFNYSTNSDCFINHTKQEKNDYDECLDMDLTEPKMGNETDCGNEKLLDKNATFENTSNNKKCEEPAIQHSFDVNTSFKGYTNMHDIDSVNVVCEDVLKVSAIAHSKTFDVELLDTDINNGTIGYQDNQSTTIDLLKDINKQVTDIENSDNPIAKDVFDNLDNKTNFNGDPQKQILEYIETESATCMIVNDEQTISSSISDYINADKILNDDFNTTEDEKTLMVTGLKNIDLVFDNPKVLNGLEDNMTVLEAETIDSNHDINPVTSEVSFKSAVSDLGTKCSSEICLKTELKSNFETSLSINNTEKNCETTINAELQNKSENIIQHSESIEEIETGHKENDIPNFDVETTLRQQNEDHIEAISFEIPNNQNYAQEDLKTSSNISIATCSSKNTDDDNTVREILTEDEDTVEGPFLEGDEYSDPINIPDSDIDKNMMQFDFPPPITNVENNDNDELFIDAEAFEFLLNQNKSNVIAESGKESLFLKFDPLFAKRLSSDGILAALSKIQKRQSTPKKSPKPLLVANNQIESLQPETSKINVSNQILDHIEVPSVVKPMMVVNPAVTPVASPRKTTPKLNRQSLTFTSPAIAVIDRLLSLNANNSVIDQSTSIPPVGRQYNETDIAITQLRELLAEKEINVHNLRCESKELKDRLANLESQMKSLETESEERLRKMNILNERLAEKTKINKSMALVVEEYERTIASLISDIEQDKKRNAEERMKLVRERDEQTAHLASMEVSFSDLHSKYEKSKQIILSMKANEDKCKNSLKDFEDSLTKMQSNYEFLKQHATSKLNHANAELEKINKAHESEVLKLNALIKRKELHITSLEETLLQKTKANEELTAICDELINKVG